jgi:predicted RNA-binding protein with PUA-like domain
LKTLRNLPLKTKTLYREQPGSTNLSLYHPGLYTYSFDDLVRDGETTWDGISNPTALMNLRSMKPGEKLIIYHSNVGKAAIGTAKVVSVDASNPKDPKVRIQPGKRLKQEKTLDDMRAAPVFKDSILFRQFRLSVVPLTEAQYDWLTLP